MKKVAIIGANEFQNPLILAANSRGYETHVFAWQDGSIGERTAHHFYPISITEVNQILDKCRSIGIDAICSIGSDLAAIAVNVIANALHLPSNPPETARIAINKVDMREAFQTAGLPVPRFTRAQMGLTTPELEAILDRIGLPLIVKPTDRSGSRGICKITDRDPELLRNAIDLACRQSFEHAAIVESFLTGEEFSCECITDHGRHTLLAITRKYTTGAPHFIETAHIEPAALSDALAHAVQETVFRGLDALHVTCGASHSEFRIEPTTGRIQLIEIGARMGGDCIGSDLVPLSTGIDYVGQVLDTALGLPPSFEVHPHPGHAAIRFIFTKADLDHLETLRKTTPEAIYSVSEITEPGLTNVTDSSTRCGFYILTSRDRAELVRMLQAEDRV
ncbi:MAG: ATP-grasp domain-containing protein [Clostridia bacterium]|nr:ATP-grasp domain-containing protein [Clostridia bacterium]